MTTKPPNFFPVGRLSKIALVWAALVAVATSFGTFPLQGAVCALMLLAMSKLVMRRPAPANSLKANDRLRSFFGGAGCGIALTDLQGRFVLVNPAFCQTFGYAEGELMNLSVSDLSHSEERLSTRENLRQLASGQKNQTVVERRYRKKDGSFVWIRATLSVTGVSEGGGPSHFMALTEDISARKETEDRLLQSDILRGLAGRHARLGGWTFHPANHKLIWSEEICEMLGYPAGTSPSLEKGLTMHPASSLEKFRSAIQHCVAQGQPFDCELEVFNAQRQLVTARCIGQAQRDWTGAVSVVQGAFQDISERKQTESELSRMNRALKMLGSCNEALIRFQDEQALLQEICKIAVDIGGYRMAWVGYADDDEERGVTVRSHAGEESGYLSQFKFTWGEDHPLGGGPVGRTLRSGQVTLCADIDREPYFQPFLEAAQKRGYRSIVCLPLRSGEPTFGLLGLYSVEVSQVKDDELKLLSELSANLAFGITNLRSHQERERIQSTILTMAASVSATGDSQFFQQLVANMTEAVQAQIGFVAEMLPGPSQRARTVAVVAEGRLADDFDYALVGTPCENLLTRDDCIVPAEVAQLYPTSPTLAALGAQGYVGARLTDSSGQTIGMLSVLFLKPLKQSELVISTLRIFAARAASELERRRKEAQVREQASLLDKAQDAIFVLDLHCKISYWNKSAQRLYGWSESEALGQPGRDFLYRGSPLFAEALNQVVGEPGEWSGEFQLVSKDGRALTVESRWTLVSDESGRPKSVLVIETDITERRKLEAKFYRVQRMESIGTLASGIAHDLNNVLSPILMSVHLLQECLVDEESQGLLETLAECSTRGADLVKQVLSFTRGVEGQRVGVNPASLARDIHKIVRETFPKNIHFQIKSAPDLWTAVGDPTQLHQVLMNLCVNARDAMPNGGNLTITLENVALDEVYTGMHADTQAGSYVLVEVADSGAGIPPALRERIFEPFYTTKEMGRGTGLGLSTTQTIVKSHGGFINLYSEPGKGTQFKVYLPANAVSGVLEKVEPKQNAQLPRGNGELVLVVDDEESIRTVARKILERFGYRVLLAENGALALGLYAQNREEVRVVLTDMAMPVMDGPSTIVALKALNPLVKVVGSSGHAANGEFDKAGGPGLQHFISKPYTADQLLRTLARVLQEPERAA